MDETGSTRYQQWLRRRRVVDFHLKHTPPSPPSPSSSFLTTSRWLLSNHDLLRTKSEIARTHFKGFAFLGVFLHLSHSTRFARLKIVTCFVVYSDKKKSLGATENFFENFFPRPQFSRRKIFPFKHYLFIILWYLFDSVSVAMASRNTNRMCVEF